MDRQPAAKILQVYPLAGVLARENRAFLARAVDYVEPAGVPSSSSMSLGATRTWRMKFSAWTLLRWDGILRGVTGPAREAAGPLGAGRGLPSPGGAQTIWHGFTASPRRE